MSDRMALFDCTPEFLAAMFQLPDGAYIDGVVATPDRPGVLTLRVLGAGWPVQPGYSLNKVTPIVTTRVNEAGEQLMPTIDWRLPV